MFNYINYIIEKLQLGIINNVLIQVIILFEIILKCFAIIIYFMTFILKYRTINRQ